MLLTRDEIRGVGKARDVGRLQAASVVILDVVSRKKADEVVARSGRKRRQIEKIEDREEDIGEKYKSARTGEATPSSVKKTPMRTGEGPARRRLAEVRAAALAYDEEVQAASVAEEPAAPSDDSQAADTAPADSQAADAASNRRQKNRRQNNRHLDNRRQKNPHPRSKHHYSKSATASKATSKASASSTRAVSEQ